jgi:hypothetical protein
VVALLIAFRGEAALVGDKLVRDSFLTPPPEVLQQKAWQYHLLKFARLSPPKTTSATNCALAASSALPTI